MAMDGELSEVINSPLFPISSLLFFSLYRNAVRNDGDEDRTVPHTVPLRGGAMQRHASAYQF